MNCKVCGNTSAKNPSVSFFRFPKENDKCREWAVPCDLLPLYERHGTLRFYKSFRICSDHFNPKDIVFDGRKKRLLQFATPQILIASKDIKEEKSESLKNFDGEILKLEENLCRLCAQGDRNLIDIYGFKGRILNLESKLKYLPLVINKCDILPLRVCDRCMLKLNQFHDFILNCINAETKLRIIFNQKDCNISYKSTKSNTECQDSGTDQISKESPNLDSKVKVQISSDLMMCFSENVEVDYYDNDNFVNEDDCFYKQSEANFAKTNQSTKHTNFIKEVDFSKNVIFEHDYSNLVTADQLQLKTKDQNENDQNFVDETKHPCDICLEVLRSSQESNAQTLTNAVHSDLTTELSSESCNEIFCSRFEFDEHTSRHLEDSNNCEICDKKFHKVNFLEKHSFSHQFDNSCDGTTNLRPSQIYQNSNAKILRNDQNKTNLLCGLNPKTSKLPKINTKSQKRKCKFCDRFFKNRQNCLVHEKTHTGRTPYQCKQCGKDFRSRASLRQHRSVHSDKRLYNCQECGMSFKRKDTLSNHLRIHTGERPFVCKNCGFAFKQRGDCIKHEKNHEKSFEIETKGESFRKINENSRTANVDSVTTDFIFGASQTCDGISWNEENNSSLPPFIPKTEELTQVDTFEDIISNRLSHFNYLM